jgi:hypothetical protein
MAVFLGPVMCLAAISPSNQKSENSHFYWYSGLIEGIVQIGVGIVGILGAFRMAKFTLTGVLYSVALSSLRSLLKKKRAETSAF